MEKRSYKDLILVLVYRGFGRFTAYQIERALRVRNLGGHVYLPGILDQLINEDLIEIEISQQPSITYYHVTPTGEVKAQSLIRKHGIENFSTRNNNPKHYV